MHNEASVGQMDINILFLCFYLCSLSSSSQPPQKRDRQREREQGSARDWHTDVDRSTYIPLFEWRSRTLLRWLTPVCCSHTKLVTTNSGKPRNRKEIFFIHSIWKDIFAFSRLLYLLWLYDTLNILDTVPKILQVDKWQLLILSCSFSLIWTVEVPPFTTTLNLQ